MTKHAETELLLNVWGYDGKEIRHGRFTRRVAIERFKLLDDDCPYDFVDAPCLGIHRWRLASGKWMDHGENGHYIQRDGELILTATQDHPGLFIPPAMLVRLTGASRLAYYDHRAQCISRLRRALNETARQPWFIWTATIRNGGVKWHEDRTWIRIRLG